MTTTATRTAWPSNYLVRGHGPPCWSPQHEAIPGMITRGLAQYTGMAELASRLVWTLPVSVPLAHFPCGLWPPGLTKLGPPAVAAQPSLQAKHVIHDNPRLRTVNRHRLTKQLIIAEPCLTRDLLCEAAHNCHVLGWEAIFGSKCTTTAMYVANAKDQSATVATANFFFFPSSFFPPGPLQSLRK